ncbi:CVNH domain-containing protein [Microcystis aeruginosa]|uniref:CVNH domain-containing protein n=1 Tax=Microcystis aeruginosa TaxID=1126 RepID=UPI00232E74AB|nr:CVNH domain-containing protein [Microcystis aeruginosa]MDB9392351.1 CVNH domain-containing protein [Microcystis aeruginosa CS-579]
MPNFSHTCSSINYDPNSTILSAECQARDGEWMPTELRLSDHIGNIDGELDLLQKSYSAT